MDILTNKALYKKVLLLGFILFSCTPPKPLSYTVLEFGVCTGPDSNGTPKEISDTFLASEDQIFACGHLQTNQRMAVSVNWYNEDKNERIYRETIKDVRNYFYSKLEPSNKRLPPGNYRVDLVVGKDVEKDANFRLVEHR